MTHIRIFSEKKRFSWDMCNVPWISGKGNQEEYAKDVELSFTFYDNLRDYNSKMIPNELRRIVLQSQLYGRGRYVYVGGSQVTK